MSVRSQRCVRVVALIALLALLVAPVVNPHPRPASAAAPMYPDLQTAPPAGLWIDHHKMVDDQYHYLLRFDNQVENHGGPLEIVANLAQTRDLYQNVYDQ